MKSRDEVIDILNEAIKGDKDLIELSFRERFSSTTRFANNSIHQNVSVKDFNINCRVIMDGKAGVSSTNCFDFKSLKKIISDARELAGFSEKDANLSGLPGKADYKEIKNFDREVREAPPQFRADVVKKVIGEVEKHNLNSAGQFTTAVINNAVVNNNGVSCFHPLTRANFTLTVMDETSSGYAEESSFRLKDLKIEEAAARAIKKCLDGRNPKGIEPGIYEVVIEELAVAEMLSHFSFIGFSGLDFEEGTSYLAGKLNQKVFGDNVTIIDSPFDPGMCVMPFDFEGFPKKEVAFIDKGKAFNVAYDSYTAKKYNKNNNGFAVPLEFRQYCGPVPLSLKLVPGESTKEQMISSVKKGLLITRFWYVRTVDKKKAIITGMTRDGTYFIEDGKIKYPVKNLRFTESIVNAFNKVEEISKEICYAGEEIFSAAPALKIKEFNFSSSAKH